MALLRDTVCTSKTDGQQEHTHSLIRVDHTFTNKSSTSVLCCDGDEDVDNEEDNMLAVANISRSQLCRSADIISTFPENLQKIPELKYHHWISELSKCKTPSVKRAVSHIQLIQSAIEDWFIRMTTVGSSGQLSQRSLSSGKKQLKTETSSGKLSTHDHSSHSQHAVPTPRTSSGTTNTQTSKLFPSVTRDLSLVGLGSQWSAENSVQIPDLGAQEVIAEVILLISELEADRRETQEKYLKEIRRADWLRRQIDQLQLCHLRELAALVQREHEACIMDLAELNWHVKYTQHLQLRSQARFSVASRKDIQLREHIDFVKTHVPLVQEKLVLEVDAMDNIRKAQGQADQELVVAQQKQAKVHMRSQETANKASTERGHIKRELDGARNDVKTIRDNFSEAVMTHKAYVHQMNDTHKKLAENNKEMEVLTVKNENARTAEIMQATKVRNLQLKTTEAEFEFRHLESDIQNQEQEHELKKVEQTEVERQLQQEKITAEKQLQMATRENLEKSLDLEELENKVAKLEHQKAADTKNVSRIHLEMERTTSLLQQTLDQHQQLLNSSYRLQDQLQSEKDKTSRKEEQLKKNAEGLRRQTQEEVHNKTVLQARISADVTELDKVKLESISKKDKAKSIMDELEKALNSVTEKVKKLQSVKLEKRQLTEDITRQILQTEQLQTQSCQRLSQSLAQVKPRHQTVQADLLSVTEQLQTMETDSSMMKNKIEEMDAAQTMMERFLTKADNEIQILTSEMQELELQLEAGRKIGDDLRHQLDETLERLQGSESQHKILHDQRQEVLHKHQSDRAFITDKNQQLATRYRQLQKEYLSRKEMMLKSYDERVKNEAAVTDMKQLKSLQGKLHMALVDFFKVSNLYGNTALTRLEQESLVNAGRVSELHVNMQQALEDIARFLNARKEGKLAKVSTLGSVWKETESSPIMTFEDGLKAAEPNFRVEVEQS